MQEQTLYTVSDVTQAIKLLLEESLPTLWVEGEISNFKHHTSGHYYFTLKDENAQLSAVMWRSRTAKLDFEPDDGVLVQALGNIRLYERYGRYQLDVLTMQPGGVGRLQMEFERLKKELEAEGLFSAEHKQALPKFPGSIGLVTSETGAAIRDIWNVLKRRAPHVEVIIRPTQVQGKSAGEDIARAIEEFNRFQKVDLLIVGRGGGSLEDLWAFNEEIVARSIYNSKIPVISAVGHEIDFTISDFVADLRAPTPSAAAELAVPDFNEIKNDILRYFRRMHQLAMNRIATYRDQIAAFKRSYGLRRPEDILKQNAYQLDELSNKVKQTFRRSIEKEAEHVKQLHYRLQNLSPKNVLKRGYSISYSDEGVIDSVTKIQKGQNMKTEVSDGYILSNVKERRSA